MPIDARALTLLFPCLSTLPCGADVLTVAPSGAAFTNLQVAVDAALDGDLVLVKSGVYGDVEIADKALAIVADLGQSVVVGRVTVRDLAASRTVALSGLQGGATTDLPFRDGLRLASNQGPVRIETCALRGKPTSPSGSNGGDGAFVDACADVIFTDCRLEGGRDGSMPNQSTFAGSGMRVQASDIAVVGGESRGGQGSWGTLNGGFGGQGMYLNGSAGFLFGVWIVGAHGGYATQPCGTSGDSGSGLVMANSTATALTCRFDRGGFISGPGCMFCASCFPGEAGQRVHLFNSVLTRSTTPLRRFEPPRVAREGATHQFVLRGRPNDTATLRVSLATSQSYAQGTTGVVSTTAPLLSTTALGAIGGDGTLNVNFAFPLLAPGDQEALWFAQVEMVDTQGRVYFTTPRTIAVLDAQF